MGKLLDLLPEEREGHEPTPDVAALREAMKTVADAGKWATDPPVEELAIGGQRCLVAHSEKARRATVVHFHAGGYRIGRPEAVAPFATELAGRCYVDVICPEYRLAPDNPFPAALRDAANVIEAVASKGETLILSGDSAGGGIAASLACLCRQAGIDLAGLVLISPWLDMRVTADSYLFNAQNDPLFSLASATIASGHYLQGHDSSDPLVSPVLGDVSSCPPACISVGSGEVLVDEVGAFHRNLQQAGIEAHLQVVEGMEHVAVTRGRDLPGAKEVMAQIVRFTDRVSGPSTGRP